MTNARLARIRQAPQLRFKRGSAIGRLYQRIRTNPGMSWEVIRAAEGIPVETFFTYVRYIEQKLGNVSSPASNTTTQPPQVEALVQLPTYSTPLPDVASLRFTSKFSLAYDKETNETICVEVEISEHTLRLLREVCVTTLAPTDYAYQLGNQTVRGKRFKIKEWLLRSLASTNYNKEFIFDKQLMLTGKMEIRATSLRDIESFIESFKTLMQSAINSILTYRSFNVNVTYQVTRQ